MARPTGLEVAHAALTRLRPWPEKVAGRGWFPWWWVLLSLVFGPVRAAAGEVIPPVPPKYFNDYAGTVSPAAAASLNALLENFEKTNSSQILVVIFPRMQSESSIEDYTVRVAHQWGVGQKGRDNGAVLFVFIENRTMYLQVGYGLEAVLPDVIAKDITENVIKPRFKAQDYEGGLRAGIQAIFQAIGGEYRGTGRTLAQTRARPRGPNPAVIFFVILALMIFLPRRRRRRATIFGPLGRVDWGRGPIGGWRGGGGGSCGGSWGGGSSGGGFSAGGGRFGGGGAGSSW